MQSPKWYGARYPNIDDLKSFAVSQGAVLAYADIPFSVFLPDVEGVRVIILPNGLGLLDECWSLAHELGHLVKHSGPKGVRSHGKEEAQANQWAARALIPSARIRHHQNASLDTFIGALSAHYEELPLWDCPQRRLAARIAEIRLGALEDVA